MLIVFEDFELEQMFWETSFVLLLLSWWSPFSFFQCSARLGNSQVYCISQLGLPADRDGSQTYGERGHDMVVTLGDSSWRFGPGTLCRGIMVTMRLGFAPEGSSDAVLLDLTVY